MYENRYKEKIQIFKSESQRPATLMELLEIPFPETHFFIIGEK